MKLTHVEQNGELIHFFTDIAGTKFVTTIEFENWIEKNCDLSRDHQLVGGSGNVCDPSSEWQEVDDMSVDQYLDIDENWKYSTKRYFTEVICKP